MRKRITSLVLLVSALPIFAQTQEQRDIIKASMNEEQSEKSSRRIKKIHQEEENQVTKYLKEHPEQQRSFKKDGKTYFLHHISSEGKPMYITTKDLRQAQNAKATALYSGGSLGVNITGTNMVAGVWDGGQVNKDHELLKGRVAMQAGQPLTESSDHMTAVTGIMIAKNGGGAQGLAYNATTKNYDWENDVTEMDAFAKEGYLVSNHSYGYLNDKTTALWVFGAYDSQAKEWDAVLKNRPYYLPFVAAGNEQEGSGNPSDNGYDIITGNSAAKNVVTVGAITHRNAMTDYSNWGPTDDGRIKPEIVTVGSSIDVPLYDDNEGTTGNVSASTGTSYSSPAAAAGALLLQQYYYSLNQQYMKAAMLKALLLHSADDADLPGPDAKFGWGILNLEAAANIIRQSNLAGGNAMMKMISQNPSNNELNEIVEPILGFSGSSARASLCWVDDDGVEQKEVDKVDNNQSRMVYNFSMKLEQTSPALSVFPYKNLSITNPGNAAVVGTKWFDSANNYLQANISSTNNAAGKLSIRKSKTSPTAAREMALIITGIKKSTLNIAQEAEKVNSIVFYDEASAQLKLISEPGIGFGPYAIYSTDGRLIKEGLATSQEIDFDAQPGIFILNYIYKDKTQSYKFIKK